MERSDRPAIVRFERKTVEDKPASLLAKRYVAKDVDYALVTPPYSKDVIPLKIEQWKANMKQDLAAGRIPPDWVKAYEESYEKWLNGQEMPPNGTAIRGWGVISPAQQENLIRINILTVEDLAAANDEGKRRIGMGALELITKAQTWLKQMTDAGGVTIELAQVKTENANLKAELEGLKEQVARISKGETPVAQEAKSEVLSLSADDILPDEPVKRRK